MGLTHFFQKPQLRFLCDTFNKLYNPNASVAFEQFAREMNFPESISQNMNSKERAAFMTLLGIPMIIKQNQREEFKRYSISDINRIIQGRFEILGIMAFHSGNSTIIWSYKQNHNILRKDARFIYDYFLEHAPNAVTLSFEEFVYQALLSLDR